MRVPPAGGPPAWYLSAIASLDASMNAAAAATGRKSTMVSDIFYLDKLMEALRIWNKTLLMHANLIRESLATSERPTSQRPLT